MIDELESLTSLGNEITRRARADGMMAIWRAQIRDVRRVLVRNGRPEDTSHVSSSGHGVQVFSDDGNTALASRDDFDDLAAIELLRSATSAARRSHALGSGSPAPAELTPLVDRAVPGLVSEFESVDLSAVARRLADLEREIGAQAPGVSLRISFLADLDGWRILRSDGTDVLFAMPRCVLQMTATSSGRGGTHSVGAALADPDPRLPWNETRVATFMSRAIGAARLARELPDAPPYPAGPSPVVIDYALAKGLAHEAFGHAAEADGFRSSILATEGRFRVGERVGPSHVSIVDEPVENDHAWQPFSSNGLRRERALVVDHGVLHEGLSDPWSATSGGVRVTGSARTGSFRTAPLPRMTNIRIEADEPLPAPGSFEAYGPAEVRDLLSSSGVLRRHNSIAFLSGYSGGQVNTSSGDFVFNCKAIYELSADGIRLHKPAIFSGSMFGALGAIREAFGPLLLDALGTCGKWGQSVPSSGGSHYFLVLEEDPGVRLGGN